MTRLFVVFVAIATFAAADLGNRLYAVNARFNTPATPTTDYWITQLRK